MVVEKSENSSNNSSTTMDDNENYLEVRKWSILELQAILSERPIANWLPEKNTRLQVTSMRDENDKKKVSCK